MKFVVFISVAVLFFSTASFSQVDRSGFLSATSVGTTTSNYYFAKPNELTIIVNVLGFVKNPGRYEISSTIDLINLLALAGGPSADGAMNDVKITRLVSAESRYERKEFRLNLEQLTKITAAELVLHPGDIIDVERTGWSTFRDVFSVVISAAVLTSAVASVVNLTRK